MYSYMNLCCFGVRVWSCNLLRVGARVVLGTGQYGITAGRISFRVPSLLCFCFQK